MSEKPLKFGNIIADKKEFQTSKKPITLILVDIEKIVVSNKFKHSDKGFKYFIDYTDNVIRPLCIILSQMSGYIKYFDDGGKNMSFKIEDDTVLVKYNEIWKKNVLNIKFHSKSAYDEKYIKTKVKYLISINIPKENSKRKYSFHWYSSNKY